MKGKLIGIDHGTKRIGIAVSDGEQIYAWPRKTVSPDIVHDFLKGIIEEEGCVGIVVGLPLMPNGKEGEQCVRVRKFVDEIKEYWPGDIFFVDERLTSQAVKQNYGSEDDSLVAASILNEVLG